MWKGKRICQWAVLMVGLWVSFGLSGHRTAPNQPLPFDPSVTLLVAIKGRFYPRIWQRLVLYPTVTAYSPNEPYKELEEELPPEEWARRMVQAFTSDQLPEDWVFFFPEEEPLKMHVAIYDERRRLSKAIIKAWDETVLGELSASPNGGEIASTVNISPDLDRWVIEIWGGGKRAMLLGRAVGRTPKVMGLLVKAFAGFVPEENNPFDVSNPLLAPEGENVRIYSHTETFPDNDYYEVIFDRPQTNLGILRIRHFLKIQRPFFTLLDKQAHDEFERLESEFASYYEVPLNRANWALQDAMIPPYSRNVQAVWNNIEVRGKVLAIVLIPVYAKDRSEWVTVPDLKIERQTRKRASEIWAAQINLKISQKRKRELQIGNAQPLADFYALESNKVQAKVQAEPILQPVTISVQPDKPCVPLTGGVQISKEGVQPDVGIYRECTTHGVSMPRADECDVHDGRSHNYIQHQLPPPSYPAGTNSASLDQQGKATVQLPKGFRYRFVVPGLQALPCVYEIIPEKVEDVNVPPTTQVNFSARLTNVGMLKVYVYPPENPIGVRVELSKRLPDGNWSLLFSAPATYDEKTKAYLASFGNLRLDRQPDGSYSSTYQVKAIINLPPTQSGSGPRVEERTQTCTFEPSCEIVVSM